MERDFKYFAPISFFEKGDAPEGQRRRFGGVATTESRDQEDEILLQRGLDFSPFLKSGWFNDNHSKKTGGVVGYPTDVKVYKKGETLPDGGTAPANCHWTEGYLLEGVPAADDIWRVGQALQKAGGARRLGQSIEGRVVERDSMDGKVVRRAEVRNVAITHCPVNAETSLGLLAKALTVEDAEPLIPESLEGVAHNAALPPDAQLALVARRYPNIGSAACGRILDVIHQLMEI